MPMLRAKRCLFSFILLLGCLLTASSHSARASFGVITPLAPTSGWLVGQMGVAQENGDNLAYPNTPLPCLAMNQFENGFIVRLSGGGGQIAALAIDFRQAAFGQGERYPLRISIDQSYRQDFEGTAFDTGTLVVDTASDRKLYAALKAGDAMIVGLGGSVAAFSLRGMSNGLERLEACQNPSQTAQAAAVPPPSPSYQSLSPSSPADTMVQRETLASVSDPTTVPLSSATALNPMPPGLSSPDAAQQPPSSDSNSNAPLKIDAVLKVAQDSVNKITPPSTSLSDSRKIKENRSEIENDPRPYPDLWTAVKDEPLQSVLSRWSKAARINLVWNAKNETSVSQDFEYQGSFNDAVKTLLATATSRDVQASFQPSSQSPGPKGQDTSFKTENDDFDTAAKSAEKKWTATKGADLRDTLAAWSRREGIELVWQSPTTFSIPLDMALKTRYESAVDTLLKQSASRSLRPVGELRKDPGSGRSALVIRVEGDS